MWLLLVYASLAAADTDTMADKTQMPSRDRAMKGRDEKMVVAGKYHAGTSFPTSWHETSSRPTAPCVVRNLIYAAMSE